MAFVGLRDIHVALLDEDTIAGVKYKAPEKIGAAIAANVNPNTASGTLFAEDGPMETASALGEIEVEINTADLSNAMQAKVLGHTIDSKGILRRKASDVAPFLAIGYRSLKSNGHYRYVWLLKGKFRVPEQAHETKTDDINFQTPTIVGSFLKREFDDEWQIQIDSDDPEFDESIATNWFKEATIDAPTVP